LQPLCNRHFLKVSNAQPFSQNFRTSTVATEFQIGLYDPAEADLELFMQQLECGIFGRTDLELFCNAGFLGKRLYLRRTAVFEVLWTQTWDPSLRQHLFAGVTRSRLMFLLGKPSHTRPSPLAETRWHAWLHRGGGGCVTAACLDGAYLAAELRRVPAFPAAAPAGRGAGHMPAAAPAGRGAGHSTRKCTAAP